MTTELFGAHLRRHFAEQERHPAVRCPYWHAVEGPDHDSLETPKVSAVSRDLQAEDDRHSRRSLHFSPPLPQPVIWLGSTSIPAKAQSGGPATKNRTISIIRTYSMPRQLHNDYVQNPICYARQDGVRTIETSTIRLHTRLIPPLDNQGKPQLRSRRSRESRQIAQDPGISAKLVMPHPL